jgi:aspartate-semialdehyde dehydrogenase
METAMRDTGSALRSSSRLRHSLPVVAIVGATGAVRRELVQILEQRRFPLAELRLFAPPRLAGRTLALPGCNVPVAALSKTSFDRTDLPLFSPGSAAARHRAPIAMRAGAVVIYVPIQETILR